MKRLFENRLLAAALLFMLTHIIGGLLVAAPLLVFMRVQFEHSGSAMKLWPVMSIEVLGDLMINNSQALMVYLIASVVIYLAYFPLRVLATGAIYHMVILEDGVSGRGASPLPGYLAKAVTVWTGFLKAAIFGLPVYGVALLLGLTFGGILARIWTVFKPLTLVLFLLLASTYLQILRIHMVTSGNSSLRNSMVKTRAQIAASLGRIAIGNASVGTVAILGAGVIWLALRWVRGFEWSFVSAGISLIFQQGIVFVLCLSQAIRINFNNSVLRKGD
jgi:hypothetical protein